MKRLFLLVFLLFLTQPTLAAGKFGILHPTTPINGETLIKHLIEKIHGNHLLSSVLIIHDGQGRRLVKVHHSNGTRSDHRINFAILCNATGKVGKDHQYLGHSYHGAVERVQYYTLDCPSNNIGINFTTTEEWNPINLTLKIVSAIWGTYTW